MKRNKNLPKLSPLGELIQDAIEYEADKKYFGTRKELNRELLTYLKSDVGFKNDIKKLKRELSIPKLNSEEDIESFEYDNYIDAESFWLRTQDHSVRDTFEKRINNLLISYGLPIGFYDWMQYLVLYGQPPWTPLYNTELPNDIMSNPDELQRIPLTTQEKKYVRRTVKNNIGIKGRPSKKARSAYGSLLQALSMSKNKQRRIRNLTKSLKTGEIGTKRTYYDSVDGKVQEKITSTIQAAEIYEHADNDELKKKANTLRKMKQRLKERQKVLLKK